MSSKRKNENSVKEITLFPFFSYNNFYGDNAQDLASDALCAVLPCD